MAEEGIEPALRHLPSMADSALLTLLTGCFVVNAVAFPTLLRLWGTYFKQLLRPRADLRSGERTSAERLVLSLGVVQCLVFEALALLCVFAPEAHHPFGAFGGLLLLAVALFAVQTGGYSLTGYAFATPGAIRAWLHSYFLTRSLLGYLIMIPTLGALFYPGLLGGFAVAVIVAYALCSILFYINGFAIFYTSPASIFHFFLYLCTLEIVPLVILVSLTDRFSALFC